jgi:hypothetical protein
LTHISTHVINTPRNEETEMTKAMSNVTGIEAALREAKGQGALAVEGRAVVYREGRYTVRWSHRTSKEAAIILRVLRAAPKYVAA